MNGTSDRHGPKGGSSGFLKAAAAVLLPSFVLAPVVGVVVFALWLTFARRRRSAPIRDLAIVVAAVAAVVAWSHAPTGAAAAGPTLAGIGIVALLLRLDATADHGTSAAFGLGAAGMAVVLAAVAVHQSSLTAFESVHTLTFHRSATAELALVLAAGSALARRGGAPRASLVPSVPLMVSRSFS